MYFFSRGLSRNTGKENEREKGLDSEGLGDAKELHTPIYSQPGFYTALPTIRCARN